MVSYFAKSDSELESDDDGNEAPKKRSAKKMVSYFAKSDSELESDDDGNEAPKKRSIKKMVNKMHASEATMSSLLLPRASGCRKG